MDILLINTPFLPLNYSEVERLPLARQERTSVSPPLGICYISSYLISKGYNVSLLDLDVELYYLLKTTGSYNILDIAHLIRQQHVDIIGISCFNSARHKQAHELARLSKAMGSTVVMGGNYPTNSPERVLKDKSVDYVVLGEGEHKFYELLQALEEGIGLEEISGIGYRETIRQRSGIDYIKNLDILPFPDYANLDIEKYYKIGMSQSINGNNRFFTLFTSRGCPNKCIYCGAHNTFGYKNRLRSVDNVIREVDWLIDNYGAEEILIQDDNFTADRVRSDEILDKLAERKIHWSIPNGLEVNSIDRSFLEKAKASGCTDLSIAVESGSPKVLKMINKKMDLERAKETIRSMRELGIYSKVFFMVGFPGETKEDIQLTLDLASNLKADWSQFSIVNPLPGTELAKNREFNFENIGYSNANIKTDDFTPEYIEGVVSYANLKTNFLENPNLNGGNINWAIRDFKRISDRYPEHKIARESLGRALEKNLYNR